MIERRKGKERSRQKEVRYNGLWRMTSRRPIGERVDLIRMQQGTDLRREEGDKYRKTERDKSVLMRCDAEESEDAGDENEEYGKQQQTK